MPDLAQFLSEEALEKLKSVGLSPADLSLAPRPATPEGRGISDKDALRMMLSGITLPPNPPDLSDDSDLEIPYDPPIVPVQTATKSLSEETALDTPEARVLTATIKLSDPLQSTFLSEAGKKFIKVPMIYKNEWEHPDGPLVIDDTWMDSVITNFQNNALGYQPALYLGHPLPFPTVGGAPAEAFLVDMQLTEDGKLQGLYECVSDETYEDVRKGRYRYASIEFDDIRDKETGAPLGPAIVGCALTNRPFIPNLEQPTVFSLSEEHARCTDSRLTVLLQLDADHKALSASEPPAVLETPSMPETENLKDLRAEFDARVAEIESAYSSRMAELEATVTKMTDSYDIQRNELMSQVANLQAQLSEAQAEVKAKKLSEKLARLNGMMLSDEVKTQYEDMLKEGQLGAAEEKVLKSLEQMSDFNRRALSQFGTAANSVSLSEKQASSAPPSAFSSIVERNRARAQKLQNQE